MSDIIEIDPTVDFACKLVIGNPELPELTIHFLGRGAHAGCSHSIRRDPQSDQRQRV